MLIITRVGGALCGLPSAAETSADFFNSSTILTHPDAILIPPDIINAARASTEIINDADYKAITDNDPDSTIMPPSTNRSTPPLDCSIYGDPECRNGTTSFGCELGMIGPEYRFFAHENLTTNFVKGFPRESLADYENVTVGSETYSVIKCDKAEMTVPFRKPTCIMTVIKGFINEDVCSVEHSLNEDETPVVLLRHVPDTSIVKKP